jgi:hypothetical protein
MPKFYWSGYDNPAVHDSVNAPCSLKINTIKSTDISVFPEFKLLQKKFSLKQG